MSGLGSWPSNDEFTQRSGSGPAFTLQALESLFFPRRGSGLGVVFGMRHRMGRLGHALWGTSERNDYFPSAAALFKPTTPASGVKPPTCSSAALDHRQICSFDAFHCSRGALAIFLWDSTNPTAPNLQALKLYKGRKVRMVSKVRIIHQMRQIKPFFQPAIPSGSGLARSAGSASAKPGT